MTAADADAVRPVLPDVPTVVLSSQDVYEAHATPRCLPAAATLPFRSPRTRSCDVCATPTVAKTCLRSPTTTASVRAEHVDIFFADGVLTISGERSTEPAEEVTFYTRELYYGPFRRSMILPDGVEEDRISASFADGIAEITVRGACAAVGPEPRRIPITDRSSGQVPLTGRGRPGGRPPGE